MTYGITSRSLRSRLPKRPPLPISKQAVRALRVQLRDHGIEEGLEAALRAWIDSEGLRIASPDNIREATDRGW